MYDGLFNYDNDVHLSRVYLSVSHHKLLTLHACTGSSQSRLVLDKYKEG